MEKEKKEIHEKTKKLIQFLNLNRTQISKIVGKHSTTISLKINDKSFFTEKEYEKLVNYNKTNQEYLKSIKVIQ